MKPWRSTGTGRRPSRSALLLLVAPLLGACGTFDRPDDRTEADRAVAAIASHRPDLVQEAHFTPGSDGGVYVNLRLGIDQGLAADAYCDIISPAGPSPSFRISVWMPEKGPEGTGYALEGDCDHGGSAPSLRPARPGTS